MPLNVKLNQLLRLSKQWINPIKIAIIGGYHGGNLGDIALGLSVKEILDEKKIKSGLQTIYTLDKLPWPQVKTAILGGGSVGYTDSLKKVAQRYKMSYGSVSILGVDYPQDEYNDNDVMQLLRGALFLSCRSAIQGEKLSKISGRNDIITHPDLAFSFQRKYCKLQRSGKKEKLLLVNLIPLYGQFENGKLVAIDNYKKERPELYANYAQMIDGYRESIRAIVQRNIEEGFRVESIPFTPEDKLMAELVLKDLPVHHNEYTDNPMTMLKKMARAQRIIATRYHATIFTVKVGAEILPIAYALKNERMLEELGITQDQFTSTTDLANGKVISNIFFKVDRTIVEEWESSCYEVVSDFIEKISDEK